VSFEGHEETRGLFTMYYSVFWRAQRDKRCTCPRSRYISHYLVLGGFCCISVSSPPFFIIEGSFTMYSNVVWRAQRDERFACLHSGAIPHYLVLGGRLCCISVSSWGLYCPPVIPAKLGWFSEVEVGRWASPKLSRTESSPEGWISPMLRLDQDWTRTEGFLP